MSVKRLDLPEIRSIDPIQDLFFKPRTIFRICRDEYEHREVDNEGYVTECFSGDTRVTDLDPELKQFLVDKVGSKTVVSRIRNEDCSLYVARTVDDGQPAGFYWGVIAASSPVWHDSFRVPTQSGLVFNAYVKEDHRRKGVYRLLQAVSHNHLLSSDDCECVFTIVENRNTASMGANREFGLQAASRNYLLKFLSVNVFSIVSGKETDISTVLTKGGL